MPLADGKGRGSELWLAAMASLRRRGEQVRLAGDGKLARDEQVRLARDGKLARWGDALHLPRVRGPRQWGLAAVLAVVMLALLKACADAPDEEMPESEGPVVLRAEDVVVVAVGEIEAGPLLSGSLQPERSAKVLAEISGAVLRVSAEPGQSVARGAVIVQIEDAALREAVLSARAAATTAQQALTLAARNAERSQALLGAGAISQRQLEDARLAVESARAQQTDAQARLALARTQLAKATVRAPFAGVVSERPVSTGDVVQPGTELFTLVDPASMRLEAGVPSTELAFVREGFQVEFEVTGYEGRTFLGRITRVTPTVDPITRQVTVYVTIPNEEGRLVGGLYAEGRLAARARSALLVPAEAVDLATTPPTVLRVEGGVVELIPVEVGLRDDGLERLEIVAGLMAGDTVLVGTARAITPGTPVQIEGLDAGGGGGPPPAEPSGPASTPSMPLRDSAQGRAGGR